ncbi:hypothetical protein L1987_86609 [Smallanthus sonchifolius]|uniref:Uncharacterized protein n=1 Tax=Smallanthus sonchifolius TaxID=185202 RepID=A0ACB8XZU7_9ASTR|nr:hypothetical protein L1987_86609 [Smallanthus sonchifolius]
MLIAKQVKTLVKVRERELGLGTETKGKAKQQMQMTSLCLKSAIPSCALLKSVGRKQTSISCCTQPKSFFLNPSDDRILKKAFKEPVAFMGGVFAGVLRLDLNEDPLKEWVTRTVEACGIITDEEEEELDIQTTITPRPQQIEID